MSDFTEKWTTAAANEIAKIIERAIAEERDACAKIADRWTGREHDDLDVAEEIAVRIRSARTAAVIETERALWPKWAGATKPSSRRRIALRP